MSEKLPQSPEALKAREDIKVEEKKIKEQRILLKKAKTEAQKKACLANITESTKLIAGYKEKIQEERGKLLKPFVEKVLNLVDMGRADEIPLPEAAREQILELAKTKGAKAVAAFIESALSRSSINQALVSAFEGYNEGYYKTAAEKAEEAELGKDNLNVKLEERKNAKAERNVFGRMADRAGRIHGGYFKEGGGGEAVIADQDLKDVCGGAIHNITRLVPNSILKTAFGFESIQDIGGDVVANLLHKPLNEELTITGVVDDIISGVDDSFKSKEKSQIKGLSSEDKKNLNELDELIKTELRALETEENLRKQMLKSGAETAAHIYVDVILASVKSIGTAVNKSIDKVLGSASPVVRSFFRKIYIAALFEAYCNLMSWLMVPPIMALEAMIRFYLSFRAENVVELLHLDINENLADTVLDTIVNELQHSINEINLEAQAAAVVAGEIVVGEPADASEIGSQKDDVSVEDEDEGTKWRKEDL